jgi:hypothetical protein
VPEFEWNLLSYGFACSKHSYNFRSVLHSSRLTLKITIKLTMLLYVRNLIIGSENFRFVSEFHFIQEDLFLGDRWRSIIVRSETLTSVKMYDVFACDAL